ncbi:MAG: hypothetical protein Q9159_003863 [Coniocarpon cinnabarinum]
MFWPHELMFYEDIYYGGQRLRKAPQTETQQCRGRKRVRDDKEDSEYEDKDLRDHTSEEEPIDTRVRRARPTEEDVWFYDFQEGSAMPQPNVPKPARSRIPLLDVTESKETEDVDDSDDYAIH